MKKYRLKKDAIPFFKEKIATSIQSWDDWNNIGVDNKALEEVEELHITYGHREGNSSWLAGWNAEKGSHFHFTINYPSVKFMEHDQFSNGKVVRELMNKIQSQLNNFYLDFINNNPATSPQ